ncbi:MAG: hypothetical protein IPP29_06765 [Bacteroidetes bacterium]|nr:hypothetical protein [Bacteroidota bacterium]
MSPLLNVSLRTFQRKEQDITSASISKTIDLAEAARAWKYLAIRIFNSLVNRRSKISWQ